MTARSRPARKRPILRAAATAAAAAGLTFSSSCRSRDQQGVVLKQSSRLTTDAPIPRRTEDLTASLVIGGDNGLEARVWLVEDPGDAVASALGPWEIAAGDPEAGIRASVVAAWRRNGVRLARVPLAETGGVLASLRLGAVAERQWLGQAPKWRAIHAGAVSRGARALRIEGVPVALGSGRLVLLTRAWTAPTPEGAALMVDLAVQHLPSRVDALLEPSGRQSLFDQGFIISALSLQAIMRPGWAYVLAPEDPGVDWSDGPDAPAPDEPTPPGDAPAGPAQLGPHEPPAPHPGETLLVTTRDRIRGAATKSLIVLIPRVPDQYRLLQPR